MSYLQTYQDQVPEQHEVAQSHQWEKVPAFEQSIETTIRS